MPLPVPLVAYHEDGCLRCACRPGDQMGMRATGAKDPVVIPPVGLYTQEHPLLRPDTPQQTPEPCEPKTFRQTKAWLSKPETRPTMAKEATHSLRAKAWPNWQKLPFSSPPPTPQSSRILSSTPGLCNSLPQRLHVVEAVRAADVVDKHEGVCVLQAPVLSVWPLLGAGSWGLPAPFPQSSAPRPLRGS